MSSAGSHPAPPVLSTPDTHIFETPTPTADYVTERLNDSELYERYEVLRAAKKIHEGGWTKVALQFEDYMLPHAVRVYESLQKELGDFESQSASNDQNGSEKSYIGSESLESKVADLSIHRCSNSLSRRVRLFILADTSYGACCVDEIAAEHVGAEVVVHYGRACLSPTARLPVIYVFTTRPVDSQRLVEAFERTYVDREQNIILMSDVPYSSHQDAIYNTLLAKGYTGIYNPRIIHNPSSPIPNRTLPPTVSTENRDSLKTYAIFHIGQPPTALLLTLASRVSSIHIYDPARPPTSTSLAPHKASHATLRRRYALVTSLSTCSTFGILINTLSVVNYQHMASHIATQIRKAGKKSYTFVVGKVNAAKIANFAEIGGWVVVGCWESSLVESAEFYRPMVTPFELEIALRGDGRVWTGDWRGDFDGVLGASEKDGETSGSGEKDSTGNDVEQRHVESRTQDWDEEDSEPPEFDFRTGRYVSHSRPMKTIASRGTQGSEQPSGLGTDTSQAASTLIRREKGELAQIGGVVSPGAEYLREKRTWQGLGSDFETDFTGYGSLVEEGRSGIARGYNVGDEKEKR
jgi:diphthamide biosynthesis protein 2